MMEKAVDVIVFLEASAQQQNKIFVPDELDEKICENILIFFRNRGEDTSLVEACVLKYIALTPGFVVAVKDFALKLEKIYLAVKEDLNHELRIQALLEATKKRMENS